jgi:hypothetical protein
MYKYGGRRKRENNGGDETNPGTLYIYMEMSPIKTTCTTNIH